MPIRINLLAEAVAQEELRRRDPVKRAVYGGVFLIVLSFVWFSYTWLEFVVDKQKLNSVQGQIEDRTNEYAQVQVNLKKIDQAQTRLDSLDRITLARFLQGNLMNALQETYVSNVWLSHFHVDQTYAATAAVPAKTNSFGVVPGRPAAITEHVTLMIDAKDFSPNPGDQVNHFKDAIFKQDYFRTNVVDANSIRLLALSSLQTPLEGRPFVMFSLECRFSDRNP